MPGCSLFGRWAVILLSLGLVLAQPALAAGDILIGQSVVKSGPMAANGILYSQGIALQIDAVNAQGGVHGRKIRLIVADDAYSPDKAIENTRRFIDDHRVMALFGYAGTGVAMATAPLAEQAGVPLIAPLTGATQVFDKGGKQLFVVRANYYDEMRKMVEHLTTLGTRSIAIAYQDDGFGRSGYKSAEDALAEFGLKPAAIGVITAGTYEADKAAADVAAANPAAIIMASAGKASVNFIRAYHATGRNAQFLGLSVVSSNQLLDELGNAADGIIITQIVPSPRTRTLQIVRDFHRDAAAAGNVEINHTTLEGYIAARVLVEALRRAGPEVSPAGIATALESMGNVNLGGFTVSFGPKKHAGSNYVDISMVRASGQFVQ
ncbi:MAG: ABC transporter substrate-binding protein [Rhodocyclaceae bacterium]|jgi:ABC-type branched-subunit amino acid transport system substrate-binding protein|nr:ABC transporter substrate-binding protein [Rhodocyclaceae bacterium]